MKRLVAAIVAIGFLAAPAAAFALQQNPNGAGDEKSEIMTFKKGDALTGTRQGAGLQVTGETDHDVDNFRLTRVNFMPELLDSANEI